ncbi:MAG TPA: hypothetical protein VGM05_22255 [Planctomycetaceae bacterium]|jgi:hypothetical protein
MTFNRCTGPIPRRELLRAGMLAFGGGLALSELLATLYRHLGIDCLTTFPDHSGRPIHILNEGSPIRELI